MRAVILMSGTGANTEALLKAQKTWEPLAIITDRECRAEELAIEYGVAYAKLDIVKFYLDRDHGSTALIDQARKEVRKEYSKELLKTINMFNPDFCIFAGFKPLVDYIYCEYPCLNVHPGDLTKLRNGVRLLTGLGVLPVKKAILSGHKQLRSSVILVDSEEDHGPVIGLSDPVDIDFTYFRQDFNKAAHINLELLKQKGDLIILPKTVEEFSKNLERLIG